MDYSELWRARRRLIALANLTESKRLVAWHMSYGTMCHSHAKRDEMVTMGDIYQHQLKRLRPMIARVEKQRREYPA